MIGALVRLNVRRDRWTLGAWVVLLGLLPVALAASTRRGYPDQAAMVAFARESMMNVSEVALRGRIYSVSLGGLTAWVIGSSAALLSAVVATLFAVRYTRADEQTGLDELVLGESATRRDLVLAAFLLPAGAGTAVGLVTFSTLTVSGLPVAGSAVLGLVLMATTVAFAAIAVLTAQVAESPGTARGSALAVLGIFLVIAAFGDTGNTPLVWFSPIGWARHAEPFARNQVWTLLFSLALAAAALIAALVVNRRRDYQSGVLAAKPGPAHAAGWIGGPFTLSWRLQRFTVLIWAGVFAVLGVVIGSVVTGLDTQLTGAVWDTFVNRHGGGSIGTIFFQFVLYVLAQIGTAVGVATVLRLRTDETSGLADSILARPVTRTRWALSQTAVAVVVVVVILGALGLGAGLASQRPSYAVTALAYLPAALVLVGLALALIGLTPRIAAAGTWTVFGLLLLLDFLNEFNVLPAGVVTTFSPYAATFTGILAGTVIVPIAVLSVVAAALAVVGIVALRHRDLHAA